MENLDKLEFIAKVDMTHRDYETALASLTEAQLLQPRTCGEWTVKDVMAHITWYEREMIGVLKECALVGSDLWNLPLDSRNAAIYAEIKDHPLSEILNESKQIHQTMLELLEELTDDDLLHASRFREIPPAWIPWQVIASNTFEHYPVHTADIRKVFY